MADLKRIVLEHDCDCGGCQCPLMPGEVAWRDEATLAVGCCQPCARDASEAVIDRHEVAAFRAGFELNVMAGGVA